LPPLYELSVLTTTAANNAINGSASTSASANANATNFKYGKY